MKGEKSAIDEFLGGLNKSPDDPLNAEKDPFASVEETETEEETETMEKADEKQLPFHRDPKVQKYVEKQIEKALKDIKPSETTRFREETKDESDEITSVLERIIGNDTPEKQQGVKDLRKVLGGLEEKAAVRALEKFQEQAQAIAAEDQRAKQQLEESFEEVEETYGVDLSSNTAQARKMRSDFVDYIRKIAPKNADGEVESFPDIPAAFEEFQERQKRTAPTNNRAKELASRGMNRSTDASAAPVVADKSWKGVDKLFSKLTS